MKKKHITILLFLFFLFGCVSEEKIIIDESLTEDIYFSTDRMHFQDNIILNDYILTIHYPEGYVSYDNYFDVKTVLKKYNLNNGDS